MRNRFTISLKLANIFNRAAAGSLVTTYTFVVFNKIQISPNLYICVVGLSLNQTRHVFHLSSPSEVFSSLAALILLLAQQGMND